MEPEADDNSWSDEDSKREPLSESDSDSDSDSEPGSRSSDRESDADTKQTKKRQLATLSPTMKRARVIKTKKAPVIKEIKGIVKSWNTQCRSVQIQMIFTTSAGIKKHNLTMPDSYIVCRMPGTCYTFMPDVSSARSIFTADRKMLENAMVKNISGPRDLIIVDIETESVRRSLSRPFCLEKLKKLYPHLEYRENMREIFRSARQAEFPFGTATKMEDFLCFNNAELFEIIEKVFGPYLRPKGYYQLSRLVPPSIMSRMCDADIGRLWTDLQNRAGRMRRVMELCDPDDLIDISLLPEEHDPLSVRVGMDERRMTAEWREVCAFWKKHDMVVLSMHSYYQEEDDDDDDDDDDEMKLEELSDMPLLNSLVPSKLEIFKNNVMDIRTYVPSVISGAYDAVVRVFGSAVNTLVVDERLDAAVGRSVEHFGDRVCENPESAVLVPTRAMLEHLKPVAGRPIYCIEQFVLHAKDTKMVYVTSAEQIDYASFEILAKILDGKNIPVVICGVYGGASEGMGNVFRHLAHMHGVLPRKTDALSDIFAPNVLEISIVARESVVAEKIKSAGQEVPVVCGSGFSSHKVRELVCSDQIIRPGTVCLTREGGKTSVSSLSGRDDYGHPVAFTQMDADVSAHRYTVTVQVPGFPSSRWRDSGLKKMAVVDIEKQRLAPCPHVIYITKDPCIPASHLISLSEVGRNKVTIIVVAGSLEEVTIRQPLCEKGRIPINFHKK